MKLLLMPGLAVLCPGLTLWVAHAPATCFADADNPAV
jgi:hypothetical protein